jgi:hypothetical protein
MESVGNFKIQLRRHYPHLFDIIGSLVDEYGQLSGDDLRITATFGSIGMENNSCSFNDHIPCSAMVDIVELLESFGGWSGVSDWYMRNEYRVGENTLVRVNYENDCQTIRCFKENTLLKREIRYKPSAHLTQVRVTTEDDVTIDHDDVVEFSSAQVSVCKYFLVPSATVSGITWRFSLVQRWSGETIREAEACMLASVPPECCFKCDAIGSPDTNKLTDVQQMLLFSSMLLKIQDLLDIPNYKGNNPTTSLLPKFTFV